MLDIESAAEYLGTTVRHMRHLVAQRQITYVKVGGKVRFRKADLDTFIEAALVPALAR